MIKQLIPIVLMCLVIAGKIAAQQPVPVFVSGTDGYKTFRIPAIIVLPNGELLAFCEGRIQGMSDFGNIDIVMKSSMDRGQTWSALKVVADADSLQAGNAAPVVDRTDPKFPNGRIFLFYNTGNAQEAAVRKGNGLREAWYKTSVDGGITWSAATNITAAVHRPNQPNVNPAYHFAEDWRSYANTPGHAMQFNEGRYKGRIYIAANHSEGGPQPHFKDYKAHGYYTDDHGASFHLAATVDMPGGNESMATALSHDKLMMNSRNQQGNVKARIVSISSNGGQTWDTTYFDTTLIDPVNQGSILTIGRKKDKAVIAFCNAADTAARNNLTLRVSFDEGKTWTTNILVDKSAGDSAKDFTAYSDIVSVSKTAIGVLYERDSYRQIVFKVVKWK